MGHAAYGFAGEQKKLVSDLLEAIDIPGSEIIAISSQIFCGSSLQAKIYYLDLIVFLLPVCPNCHAMLHRRKPPLRRRS